MPQKPSISETEFQVMRELAQAPIGSQRALARRLGVSLGLVNFCLKALAEKGWVKAENFRKNPQKSQYLYVLTPQGVREKARLTLAFLERKQAEYERLQDEIRELEGEAQNG